MRINAASRDAIGVYRFPYAEFRFTAPNGTTTTFQVNPNNNTDYSSLYSVTVTLSQGQWQISFVLRDLSGDSYSFNDNLWLAPFYPVSINVVGSDGTSLQNAMLEVTFDKDATWSALTNETGWGTLFLPSTQVVGPLNLTIRWSGTETIFPLEVPPRASTFFLTLPVYNPAVRVVMNGLPIPLARVTLSQKSVVQQVFTGVNGVADFRTIPAGNYTVRVDYFLATYQSQLRVKSTGVTTFSVPLPHRTILFSQRSPSLGEHRSY